MPSSKSPAEVVENVDEELVDAVLQASRSLVAVAARSLVNLAEDVTLPQYRVLVEIAARGPQRVADLSNVLGIDPSTGTRMCDRLVRKGLVSRRRIQTDRRTVRISLAPAGRELLLEVSKRRRAELASILTRLAERDRRPVVDALRAFAEAAGELREQDWSLGWRLDGHKHHLAAG
jgi:DNA-binding MarR family transcriptional regulator